MLWVQFILKSPNVSPNVLLLNSERWNESDQVRVLILFYTLSTKVLKEIMPDGLEIQTLLFPSNSHPTRSTSRASLEI